MAKTRIEFEGFEDVVARITKLGGNVREVTEKALKETNKLVTEKARKVIHEHYLTGITEQSLSRDSSVEWKGLLANINTGFSIKNGGIASIMLMYGTPRMKKDQRLYNAFFSKKTRDEIMKIQEEIFYDEIRRLDSK